MNRKGRQSAPSAMVATENQQAAKAGCEIPAHGGNAIELAPEMNAVADPRKGGGIATL